MAIKNQGQKLAEEGTEVVQKAGEANNKPTGKIDLKEQGEAIYLAKSEEEKAALGSRSKDLAFVALITNPYRDVTRSDSKGNSKNGEETVGAVFKNVGTEDIKFTTVPNKSFKVMDADFEKAGEMTLAPGEEAKLNSIEVGFLLNRDEFAGEATGGDLHIRYSTQNPKNPNILPTTKLLITNKKGSIKDHAVSIATVAEDGKTKTMKPEFEEKFAIFSERGKKRRNVSGGSAKKKANTTSYAVHAIFQSRLESAKGGQ